MILMTSKLNRNTPEQSIRLNGQDIEPQKSLKSLGIMIDQRISFRTHVAKASNSTRAVMGMIAKSPSSEESRQGPSTISSP